MRGSSSGDRGSAPLLLRPGLWAIERLRTGARLGVMLVVLLIPAIGVTWAYSAAIGEQIDFAAAERGGVQVLRPALRAAVAAGSGERVDLRQLRTAAAGAGLGLDRVLTDLSTAQGAVAQAASTAAVVTEIGNSSKLILDPDLDSFYLMDLQVVQLPRVTAAVARARAAADVTTPTQRTAGLAVVAGELSSASAALVGDLDLAARHCADPGLRSRLGEVTRLSQAAQGLSERLLAALARPGVGLDPATATAADATLRAAAAVVDPATRELDGLLAARAAAFATRRGVTLALALTCFALASLLGLAVRWRTRRDVALALGAMTALAAGDLEPRPVPVGGDEFGDIGRALDVARTRLSEHQTQLRLTQEARAEQLRQAFLHQRAAEQQARGRAQLLIDETSATVGEELAAVVAQVDAVRDAAGTIDDRVSATSRATRDLGELAGRADQVAAALAQSLQRIAGVTRLISTVADQTKLLALNATMEAARAGAAGNGFAVVAHEVKQLANETATSTSEISGTVETLLGEARAMADTVARMSRGIEGVNQATAGLHDVAGSQREVVGQLQGILAGSMERIHGMARLTDRLERRRSQRVPYRGPVTVLAEEGAEYRGTLVDVGAGGLGATLDGVPPLRQNAGVRVRLRLGEHEVTLDGGICRWEPEVGRTHVGVEFLQPPPQVEQLLEQLVTDAAVG